jgi:long-chain fatty acid transport protein
LLPENGNFDMPADLKIGFTWRVRDKLAFSIDAEHIFHGDVAALSNPVQNQFSCGTASQGDTGPSYCLGGNNGSGLGWDSVTVYKLGGQWGIGDKWTLRAGFSVTDQPIAADQVTNNLLTQYLAEAHYALGFSRTIGEDAELNFSAFYSEEESMVAINVFDPSQNLTIESDQFNFELSYSRRF